MAGVANKLMEYKELEKVSSLLRALTHPLRIKILSFIDSNKKINVNKIYKSLRLEQSIASQHLRILRNDKLVLANRNGKFIFYTVNYRRIEQIARSLNKFFGS